MSNVLSDDKTQQVIALGKLGWSLRRIEQVTGVRRETASAYLKAAGVVVHLPGWGRRTPAKPAIGVITDPDSKPAIEVTPDFIRPFSQKRSAPSDPSPPSTSTCEEYRELIEQGLAQGRNSKAIWQDLVSDHGFAASYQAVKRFARKLRGPQYPEATGIILTPPGEEAQVDYGSGPMVRHPQSGKYRRTRLFRADSRLQPQIRTPTGVAIEYAHLGRTSRESVPPIRELSQGRRSRQFERGRAGPRPLRSRPQPSVSGCVGPLRRGGTALSGPRS
jgi:hypothetical protein